MEALAFKKTTRLPSDLKIFSSEEYKSMEKQSACLQRVLWGSTSTKDASYRDVKYVEELITKPTVNTIPSKTLGAFIDHGEVKEAFNW